MQMIVVFLFKDIRKTFLKCQNNYLLFVVAFFPFPVDSMIEEKRRNLYFFSKFYLVRVFLFLLKNETVSYL